MGFREANNNLAFKDVEAFQKINIKYNQKFVEKEPSLLDLTHNIIDYYDYWYLYWKESVLKPMLVWIYWKNREVFIEKFKSFFELGENYVEQASNFIRIYLESENIEKLKNMYISLGSKLEGCYIFPWCFSNRYIWKSNFDSVATWCLDSQGVRGTMLQYPELLKRHYLLINFYF